MYLSSMPLTSLSKSRRELQHWYAAMVRSPSMYLSSDFLAATGQKQAQFEGETGQGRECRSKWRSMSWACKVEKLIAF
jgi:hypothetical protein